MLVVGSTALNFHVLVETPNDLDLVGTYEEAVAFRKTFKATTCYPINSGLTILMKNADGRICEIEIAWPRSRAEKLLDFVRDKDYPHTEVVPAYDGIIDGFSVPSVDVLYLLKMSHRYLKNSPHFLKTMRDIRFLRNLGCEIRLSHEFFYQERMKDTYTYNLPKLNVAKDSFFDGNTTGVEQVYDHDSIHKAVALFGRPAYESFQEADSEVMCSKILFFEVPENTRLAAVVEESMVLALERSLVPFPGVKTAEEAWTYALMKVCTSITSGWFREYAWENYDAVVDLFHTVQESMGYTERFNIGLQNGVVKLKENV